MLWQERSNWLAHPAEQPFARRDRGPWGRARRALRIDPALAIREG